MAFIACHHNQEFLLCDYDNDREESHFLEEISNFEAEILDNYFQIDGEMEKRYARLGEFIITGKNSEIILHEKPAQNG